MSESRPLPHSLEAERAVLGGLMLLGDKSLTDTQSRAAGAVLASGIVATDFYGSRHQAIMRAIAACIAAREPVDPVTVRRALEADDALDVAGGLPYLAHLFEQVPSAANIAHYCRIVQALAMRRRLIVAAAEVAHAAYEEPEDTQTFATEAVARITAATQLPGEVQSTRLCDAVCDVFQEIQAASEGRATRDAPLPTGVVPIDRAVGGLQRGLPTLVAGRPSHGKSALLVQMALGLARGGAGVYLITLEDVTHQIAKRAIAAESGLDAERLSRGRLRDSEWPDLARAAGALSVLTVEIDDRCRPRVESVVGRMYAAAAKTPGLAVVIVDYIQKLRADGRWRDNRNAELEYVSGLLTAAARDLNVSLLLGAQLNREYEKRGGGRPMASDLRDCGALEQDSRLTLQLERPELFGRTTLGEPENEPAEGKAIVWVVKNTHGQSGQRIVMDFDAPTLTFREATTVRDEPHHNPAHWQEG